MAKKNMKEWSGGPSISNQNELIKVIEKLYKKSAPFRKKIDAWLKDVGAGAGAALREDEAAAEREMGWDNQTQETDYAKRQHENKITLKKLIINENSSGADFGIYDDLEDLLDIVKRSIKLADKTQFSDREAKIILDLATSIYNQTNE